MSFLQRIIDRWKPLKEVIQIISVILTGLLTILALFYGLLISKITEIINQAVISNNVPIERKLDVMNKSLHTMFKYDIHSLAEKVKDNPQEVQLSDYEKSLNLCKIYKDSEGTLILDAQMERECILIESRYVDNLSDRRLSDDRGQ